jgi:hypothetical protein
MRALTVRTSVRLGVVLSRRLVSVGGDDRICLDAIARLEPVRFLVPLLLFVAAGCAWREEGHAQAPCFE